MDEVSRLRAVLQSIVDAHDIRSELFTSGEECAENLRDRAAAALEGWDARWGHQEAKAWRERRAALFALIAEDADHI